MDINTIYVIIIGILFILAVSDLIIGVSNDAVNFLNSALGSKAFNFKVIMTVAALGILFGATFSSGMMEVARKGIFHPQNFYFSEIIFLFLAVMLTDILLLDLFNTFGMPTSTTVSIVFELLGAAVGLAVIKMMEDPNHLALEEYINSGKALTIILGILMSVVIAFSSGALFQYFSRVLFTFEYQKKIKYFGAIWGGIAISAITYFILVKGAKSASFMSTEMKHSIKDNAWLILAVTFAVWALILQLIIMFTKFDILKLIVLVGTFALAMAFSGNDLVNFIGVPLAGFASYTSWVDSGIAANEFLMTGLAGKVATPTVFLLVAGVIMALTLYFSKKARSVTETEINLGRQEEGYERFGSSALSRSVVRVFSKSGNFMSSILPRSVHSKLNSRFDRSSFQDKQKALGVDAPAFDLVRASVILTVSSIIISVATFLKLPLSTTYVTFMVAMGASLADGSWGRETAVYRITGVFSVIGGWFFTAFSAFTVAFILVFLFYYGSFYAVFAIMIIVGYILFRTHILHRKLSDEKEALKEEEQLLTTYGKSDVIDYNIRNTKKIFNGISVIIEETIRGLSHENLSSIKDNYKQIVKLNSKAESLQNHISEIVSKIEDHDLDAGNYYAVCVYYLREIVYSAKSIVHRIYQHVDNNHKPLLEEQIEELRSSLSEITRMFNDFIESSEAGGPMKDIIAKDELVDILRKLRKKQVKRIKSKSVGTRNSILFLGIVDHMRSIVNFSDRLESIHNNFVNEGGSEEE